MRKGRLLYVHRDFEKMVRELSKKVSASIGRPPRNIEVTHVLAVDTSERIDLLTDKLLKNKKEKKK